MAGRRVFVVMPFAGMDDLWELGIRDPVQEFGCQCIRGDKITLPGFVVTQIYDEIQKADVVIGVMTGKNPNVFYEIGYAHCLGKPTLLLASSKDDLTAFDTQAFRHVVYEGRIANVKKAIWEWLPLLLDEGLWPTIPSGETIFEWPSTEYSPPKLEWAFTDEPERVDVFGGQSIRPLDSVGSVIQIRNTKEYWNRHPGQSIMTLFDEANRMHQDDRLCLIAKGRVEGRADLSFFGEGGELYRNGKREWI